MNKKDTITLDTRDGIDTSHEATSSAIKPESSKRPLRESDNLVARRMLEQKKFRTQENWYACYVQPLHELQVHDYLMGLEEQRAKTRRGKAKQEDLILKVDPAKVRMESFVPLQRVRVKYSDRMVWKDKVMIPGMVFVRCSIDNREALFEGKMRDYVVGFLSDRVKHRPQPIPEEQMQQFRLLVESDYAFQMETPSFEPGQSVLILAGPMEGQVAELISVSPAADGSQRQDTAQPKRGIRLRVRLNDLLAASFELDADIVRIVPEGTKSQSPLE